MLDGMEVAPEHSMPWPSQRRFRYVLFQLFCWPFGVGSTPYTSHPERELHLRPGTTPTSGRDIDRALRRIPDLEAGVRDTLAEFIGDTFSEFRAHGCCPHVRVVVASDRLAVEVANVTAGASGAVNGSALAERWPLRRDGTGRLSMVIDRPR